MRGERKKESGGERTRRCPNIGLPPPHKSFGKLSAGEFSGGDSIMGRDFCGTGKGKTYQFRDYLSQGGFFMGETF